MKQTAKIISVYAADVSGVSSALYELSGMTVMHDASGCNSTYNTHDEPRWYDMDSLIFISALTEIDAIMGNDQKLINDIMDAAESYSPRFIAIAGTIIPSMTGTDLEAIASIIEKRTGIPSFGIKTNSMHSYLYGASLAFSAFAQRITKRNIPKTKNLSVNILGLTPLDFSINSTVNSMKACLTNSGVDIVSSWAMGSTLDDLMMAGSAHVNLVVSYSGLAAARVLKQLYGTPFVVGTPTGRDFSAALLGDITRADQQEIDIISYLNCKTDASPTVAIIGESIISGSLAAAIELETGLCAKVICPLETEEGFLRKSDCIAKDEDEIIPHLNEPTIIIADPMYQPICPAGSTFIALPHEAFSGRIYRSEIPDLVKDFEEFKKELL